MKLCWVNVFLLFSTLSFATECKLFPNDPFEPSGQMPAGQFVNSCIETEHQRSYVLLANQEEEKVITREKKITFLREEIEYQYIANVSHAGDFWVAAIPKQDPIERMVFQVEHFDPEWIAAHTQIRFDFKENLKPLLFSQTDPLKDPVSLKSLILSIEAVPMRKGPRYDLKKAMEGYFGLGTRLVSLDDKVKHIVFDERDTTDQYLIHFKVFDQFSSPELIADQSVRDLNQVMYQKLWSFALQDRADPEMKKMYHTIKKSCTNSLFEMFDRFLGRPRYLNDRAFTAMPIVAHEALVIRNLVDSASQIASLNAEFHGPAKERKK